MLGQVALHRGLGLIYNSLEAATLLRTRLSHCSPDLNIIVHGLPTIVILYNYIEEIYLQFLYQFSDYAIYPHRLPFLHSMVICFIPKRLSFC
jgi:hypothetical protein